MQRMYLQAAAECLVNILVDSGPTGSTDKNNLTARLRDLPDRFY